MATIQIHDDKQNKIVTLDKIEKSDKEWKKILNKKEYAITTKKETESPGSCTFDDIHDPGIFRCIRCNSDLFRNSAKFGPGSGWPCFFAPISKLNIIAQLDRSFKTVRIEVLCARCGSHLGHVFNDSNSPTGKRYCINGFALKFVLQGHL
jgi:peptide-methionine (R)-S-oxide reductase